MQATAITYLLVLTLLMTSCGAEGPPPQVDTLGSDTTLVQPDSVVQDQIEHTREHTPAAPDETTPPPVPDSKPVAKTAERPAPVAPPPPTNLAPAPVPQKSGPPPARVSNTAYSPPASNAPSHVAWNTLLQQHVSPTGTVDYRGFQADEKKLDEYLATLAAKTPADDWSRDESLAYWINAYNAYTIKLILDNYPLKSIRDIDQPWEKKWIALGGKTYSLNNIEHDIIRPTFREPRIHFALVCAAQSCPPLADQAFTAQNLDQLLDQRARSFINDEQYNVTQEAVVRISPLFDWYGDDFGDVTAYLNEYLPTDIPASKELTYLEYDWSLNE